MEILMAMGVLSFALYAATSTQMKQVARVVRSHDDVGRIFLLKKELYTQLFAQKPLGKPLKIELEQPKCIITTTHNEIEKKSSLAQFSATMSIVTSDGTWKQGLLDRELRMIAIIPTVRPEPQG